MAIDTSVKVFTSAMTGAPVLNGVAGSLLAILDACLVDGWGTLPISSISVASGVATISFSSPHPYIKGAVIRIAGANQSQINGDWKVSSVISQNSVSCLCPGVPDGTITGTVTGSLAPAGWAKKFSGTNVRAYAATAPAALGRVLRVDDSAALYARVYGYEAMTDVNTGTGPFPTDAQISGGFYWPKSDAANSTYRTWAIIADPRFIYIFIWAATTGAYGLIYSFGDFVKYGSSDIYASLLTGSQSNSPGNNYAAMSYCDASINNAYVAVTRAASGYGAAIKATKFPGLSSGPAPISGVGNSSPVNNFPNPSNNGLLLTPVYVCGDGVRGFFPGLGFSPQYIPDKTFNTFDVVTVDSGKNYMSLMESTGGTKACIFIDIDGPWR